MDKKKREKLLKFASERGFTPARFEDIDWKLECEIMQAYYDDPKTKKKQAFDDNLMFRFAAQGLKEIFKHQKQKNGDKNMQKDKEILENENAPEYYINPFDELNIQTLRESYNQNPPKKENLSDLYIYRMILAYDELAMKLDKIQKENEKHPGGVKALKQNVMELTNKLNEANQKNKELSEEFTERINLISNIEKKDGEKYSDLMHENKVLQDKFNIINNQFNNLLAIYNELKSKEFNKLSQKIIRFFRGVK